MNVWNVSKALDRMDKMIEHAINGNDLETNFDESKMSAIESKLKAYLDSTATKSKQLQDEKDKLNALISDISHQTKTPIANLILYASLLAENEKLPEGCEDLVQEIMTQSEKLDFLVHALIETSRLEAGIISVAPQKNSIRKLLNAAVSQVSLKAYQKNIEVITFENNEFACFDPKWTAEAIYNIVENAVKYSKADSTIKVTATPYELFCRIDITDNGIGISEEDHNKIFSRFYRGAAVAEEEGLGIGLYLARMIISKQGGYMKVKSTLGSGATFSVFLPM